MKRLFLVGVFLFSVWSCWAAFCFSSQDAIEVLSESYRLSGGISGRLWDGWLEGPDGEIVDVYRDVSEGYNQQFTFAPVRRSVNEGGLSASGAADRFSVSAWSFSEVDYWLGEYGDGWANTAGDWSFVAHQSMWVQFAYSGDSYYPGPFSIRLYDHTASQYLIDYFGPEGWDSYWQSGWLLFTAGHSYSLSMEVEAYRVDGAGSGGMVSMELGCIVPEPATLVLLSAGLAFCGLARRR